MWKLLRNLIIAALFVAGALKLLAWYAVGQDAQRVVAGLAPTAQLQYAGVSAGLDGSVSLSKPSLTLRSAPGQVFRADRVVLGTPGLHWLLRHTLLHENYLPSDFSITVDDLKLPASIPWFDRQWFDPQTFVPFPNLGCPMPTFTAADYERMGVKPDTVSERLEYRYDDSAHTLKLSLQLSAPGFADVSLAAELAHFELDQAIAGHALDKLHINQITAEYTDNNYLARRSVYCARHIGIDTRTFLRRHLDAVRELLQRYGISPGDDLVALYRKLLTEGGQVSILSLPSKDFIAGSWRALGPNVVWRQLNVTARYGTSPPVLFGLDFVTPPPEAAPAVAATAEVAQVDVAKPDVSTAIQTAPAAVLPVAPPTPPPPTPALPATPPAAATRSPATPPQPRSTTGSQVSQPAGKPVVSAASSPDNLGLHSLDREEAKLATLTPAAKARQPVAPSPAPSRTGAVPSGPAPPPGSALALVWSPSTTVEELPPSPPQERDYRVIDYSGLKHEIGHHVRLLTQGDTKLVGYVVSVDDKTVVVRVTRVDGSAQFSIPRTRIREVQLLKD